MAGAGDGMAWWDGREERAAAWLQDAAASPDPQLRVCFNFPILLSRVLKKTTLYIFIYSYFLLLLIS